MKPSSLGSFVALSLSLSALLVAGCKKEEPPPPLPSAQPVAANTAPLQLKPEDAGVKPPDAAPPPKTGGKRSGGLSACCAALAQNATMAPPPTNGYMLQAAAVCQSLAAQGKDKAAVGGILLGALKGAGMPAACQ